MVSPDNRGKCAGDLPLSAQPGTILGMMQQPPRPRPDLPPRQEMPGRLPAPQSDQQAAQAQQ
jgi:hypothetical protein